VRWLAFSLLSGCLWIDDIRERDGRACTAKTDCASNTCLLGRCVSQPFGCDETPANSDQGPVLLFTDLESAPVNGGENGLGAFVTLYGMRFGPDQEGSAVLLGDKAVARVVRWNAASDLGDSEANRMVARHLDRITVQLGPDAKSADLRVLVGHDVSNGLPFTARNGSIWFVDARAAPGGDGSPEAPFSRLYDARAPTVGTGDVVYVRGGADYNTIDPGNLPGKRDNFRMSPLLAQSGTDDAPIAIVGYPGEFPRLGGDPGDPSGRSQSVFGFVDGTTNYVIAQLDLERAGVGVGGITRGLRLVGNRMGAPLSTVVSSTGFDVLGNLFVDVDAPALANASAIDFAYNELRRPTSGIAVSGDASTRVMLHHNLIVFGTGDFSVSFTGVCVSCAVHTNVFEQAAKVVGIRVSGFSTLSNPALDISDNTFFNGASIGLDNPGSVAALALRVQSNILSTDKGGSYLVELPSGAALQSFDAFTAEANFYDTSSGGAGSPFADEKAWRAENPRYTASGNDDFSLSPFSTALSFAKGSSHCGDFVGVHRHLGDGWDAGALER
jgi:hypothetical protein